MCPPESRTETISVFPAEKVARSPLRLTFLESSYTLRYISFVLCCLRALKLHGLEVLSRRGFLRRCVCAPILAGFPGRHPMHQVPVCLEHLSWCQERIKPHRTMVITAVGGKGLILQMLGGFVVSHVTQISSIMLRVSALHCIGCGRAP